MKLYFHLDECGSRTIADEAIELPDLQAARTFAIAQARDIMSGEVLQGSVCLGCKIDIADEAGTILDTVRFSEALTITGQ